MIQGIFFIFVPTKDEVRKCACYNGERHGNFIWMIFIPSRWNESKWTHKVCMFWFVKLRGSKFERMFGGKIIQLRRDININVMKDSRSKSLRLFVVLWKLHYYSFDCLKNAFRDVGYGNIHFMAMNSVEILFESFMIHCILTFSYYPTSEGNLLT